MEGKPQYRYHKIRPTRAITSDVDFNGEIQFEWASTSDLRVDLAHSFLDLRATLNKTASWSLGARTAASPDLAGNASANNEGVAQNPFGALFKSGVLYINDKEVSRVHQFAVESTMLKMTLTNKDEELGSGSPFVPVEYSGNDYAGDSHVNGKVILKTDPAYINATNVVRNSKNIAIMERLKQVAPDLDSTRGSTANAGPGNLALGIKLSNTLSPFFIQSSNDEPLYACKVRLTLQVDPDYKKKLIQGGDDDETITFAITDFNLNIPTFESLIGPPIGMEFNTKYMEAHSSIRVNSSDSFQITMPSPSIKYIMVALANASVLNTVDNNYYYKAFQTGNEITSMYVNFANRSYPSPQYDFTGGRDYKRAYEDYVNFTMARTMGTAPMLSFSEWLMTPVFVFITQPTPGNQSNILDVQINGGDATANVLVTAWYNKELSLSYGSAGEITDTSVKFLNE